MFGTTSDSMAEKQGKSTRPTFDFGLGVAANKSSLSTPSPFDFRKIPQMTKTSLSTLSPFDFGKTPQMTKTSFNVEGNDSIDKYNAKDGNVFASRNLKLNVDGIVRQKKSNPSPFSSKPPQKKVSLASPTVNRAMAINLVQSPISTISSPFSSKTVHCVTAESRSARRVSFASPIVTSRWTPSEISSFGGPFGTTMKRSSTSKTNHQMISTMPTYQKNGFGDTNPPTRVQVDRRYHSGGILKKNNSITSPLPITYQDSANTTTLFPSSNTTKSNIFMNHHASRMNNTSDKSRSLLFVSDSTTSPQILTDAIKPSIFTTSTNNKNFLNSSNELTPIFNPTPSFNKGSKESSKKIYLKQSNKKKSTKKACKSSRSSISSKRKTIIIRQVKSSIKHKLNHSREIMITAVERKDVTSPVVSKERNGKTNEDNHTTNETQTTNSSNPNSTIPSSLHPNLLSPELMLAQQLEAVKRQTINLTGINTNWDQLQNKTIMTTPTKVGDTIKRESITQPDYHQRDPLIFSTSFPESGVKTLPRGFR